MLQIILLPREVVSASPEICMIRVQPTRSLHIDAAPGWRGRRYISAASGLVRAGGKSFVVADDGLHLAVFDDARGTVKLVKLLDGELPDSPSERKAHKPDFESLVALPPFGGRDGSALFAMGSGSRQNRQTGVLVDLEPTGRGAYRSPQKIDLTALYAPLRDEFPDLNIEGAFVNGDAFCLLQRGHAADPKNACIRFRLEEVLAWLSSAGSSAAPLHEFLQRFDLGRVDGVPLCFTDGTALVDGAWAFTAVAENTADSYNDGACLASVVGFVDRGGCLLGMERLEPPWKVEGLAAEIVGDLLRLSLVTDADDPAVAAQVLTIEMSAATALLARPD